MKTFIKTILKRIIYLNKKKNNRIYNQLDFDEIINSPIEEIKRIIFIIPGMLKYSGGHTSILRLGTQLSKKYVVEYVSYIESDISTMKEAAYCNLKDYKGKISNFSTLNSSENDILVATFWESVYYMKDLKGYKIYFIQDYEPYFYTYGDKYLLASKTYELGLHMVSLGKWNVEKIKEQLKNKKYKINSIDFPYEAKEYLSVERNYDEYKSKKELNLCVYIKESEKRIPFIIEKILIKLKEQLKDKGIKLNVTYFGNEKYLKLREGNSLGKISKVELNKLYCKSDFGMCASITNISLVPYEMLATGLPLIEFKEGSFEYFFKEESAILIDFSGKSLENEILKSLSDTTLLKKRAKNAKRILEELSWEKTGKQFIEIIDKNMLK